MIFDPFDTTFETHKEPEFPVDEFDIPELPEEEEMDSDPLTLLNGIQHLLQVQLREAKRKPGTDEREIKNLVDGAMKLTSLLLRYQQQLSALAADREFEDVVLEVLRELDVEQQTKFLDRVEGELKNRNLRKAA